MSKNKKVNKSNFNWESLNASRVNLSKDIIKQNIMISELVKLHGEQIEQDNELKLMVTGLLNSITDLANDVREISLLHATETKQLDDGTVVPVKFREGPVDENSDEYFDFLKYGNGYIAISEKLAHLVSINYIDIFTKLGAPKVSETIKELRNQGVEDTKQAIDESNKKAEDIIKGNIDGNNK